MKTRIAISCVVFLVVALGVFPKSASALTYEVLYSFAGNNDGAGPAAGLTVSGHHLFGTTQFAGGPFQDGAVFELTPPATAGGSWTEQVSIRSRAAAVMDRPRSRR
jgi:hypothetical protein